MLWRRRFVTEDSGPLEDRQWAPWRDARGGLGSAPPSLRTGLASDWNSPKSANTGALMAARSVLATLFTHQDPKTLKCKTSSLCWFTELLTPLKEKATASKFKPGKTNSRGPSEKCSSVFCQPFSVSLCFLVTGRQEGSLCT